MCTYNSYYVIIIIYNIKAEITEDSKIARPISQFSAVLCAIQFLWPIMIVLCKFMAIDWQKCLPIYCIFKSLHFWNVTVQISLVTFHEQEQRNSLVVAPNKCQAPSPIPNIFPRTFFLLAPHTKATWGTGGTCATHLLPSPNTHTCPKVLHMQRSPTYSDGAPRFSKSRICFWTQQANGWRVNHEVQVSNLSYQSRDFTVWQGNKYSTATCSFCRSTFFSRYSVLV